ncbi:MAG: CBS domain-containing protein [Rhodospirillales bacterium]
MQYRIIPDVVRDQDVRLMPADATVMDAVRYMAIRRIGAVLIGKDGVLEGIFSERDLLMRVIAKGLDPDRTPLYRAMTPNPETVTPGQTATEALELMHKRGFRHLPVVGEDGKVIGIVALRDLNAVVRRQLEDELRERDAYISDTGYGATH